MKYEPASAVRVYVWDQFVGAIAPDPDSGFYAFGYNPDWVSAGVELAPLRMPLREDPYQFPDLDPGTFYRLPAMFADALPDRFGNALVDAWMAENGVAREEVTALDRLAYAADRAMGALTFEPAAGPAPGALAMIQIADLVLAARRTVRGDATTESGLNEALRQLIQVGTSAGGARAKAVILYNQDTAQIRSGHAEHEPGFVHYLLKLDGVASRGLDGRVDDLGESAAYGRIEYAYYLMAKDAGIDMEPSQLLPEGPRAHFLTRRFDRGPDGQRHHVISLCALDHLDFNMAGTHSYDQYLDAAKRLGLSSDDIAQAYRRMVFNVAAVNRDDHTKNLSFLRREGGGWELAPAFDITYSYNPSGKWTNHHQMRVNGKVDGITLADLHAVGDRHDVPAFRRIVSEVVETVRGWERFASEGAVPDDVASKIATTIDRFAPQ